MMAILICFTGFISSLFKLLAYITGTSVLNYKSNHEKVAVMQLRVQ